MLVDEIEYVGSRGCNQRPERDVHRPARRNAHATAQREYGVQDGADRVGKRSAVHDCHRLAHGAAATEKSRAIRLDLGVTDLLAFDDRYLGGPGLRLIARATAARRQDGPRLGVVLGLDEELRKGRVRRIGGRRRQHDLGV